MNILFILQVRYDPRNLNPTLMKKNAKILTNKGKEFYNFYTLKGILFTCCLRAVELAGITRRVRVKLSARNV
jgi:hypothetical protein